CDKEVWFASQVMHSGWMKSLYQRYAVLLMMCLLMHTVALWTFVYVCVHVRACVRVCVCVCVCGCVCVCEFVYTCHTLIDSVLKRGKVRKSKNDLIHAEEGEDQFTDISSVGKISFVIYNRFRLYEDGSSLISPKCRSHLLNS